MCVGGVPGAWPREHAEAAPPPPRGVHTEFGQAQSWGEGAGREAERERCMGAAPARSRLCSVFGPLLLPPQPPARPVLVLVLVLAGETPAPRRKADS